ncbi:hypothetical protein [Sphingobium sp. BS19]|uniref:hypothetical protein n=1 Tax=Sphingobium sp. BS19 TaxID=3018973 RepID=UPI002490513B|nr:hypothetical protein [Sphingobium sp. BS19]
MPDTHINALQWLADRGGEGVIDQYGAIVAQGERMSAGSAPVWLRLFTTEHVSSAGRNRIRLTDEGRSQTRSRGNPTYTAWDEWKRQLDEDEMGGGPYG